MTAFVVSAAPGSAGQSVGITPARIYLDPSDDPIEVQLDGGSWSVLSQGIANSYEASAIFVRRIWPNDVTIDVSPGDGSDAGTNIGPSIGGGVSALPSGIGFSPSVPFRSLTYQPQQIVSSVVAFTPDTSGSIAGAQSYVRLVADGTHAPTFTGFIEHSSSSGYNNSSGVVNFIDFWFDGITYLFSVSQGVNMPLVGLPTVAFRFVNIDGDSGTASVVESGNASSGYTYTGVVGTAWQQFATSNKHLTGDGSITAKYGDPGSVGSAMVGLKSDDNVPRSWNAGVAGGFDYAIFADLNEHLYKRVSSGAPGSTNTLALTPASGDVMRVRRAGTTVYGEISKDSGSTWQIVQTWSGVSASNTLYPILCFPGGPVRAENLAQVGMVGS